MKCKGKDTNASDTIGCCGSTCQKPNVPEKQNNELRVLMNNTRGLMYLYNALRTRRIKPKDALIMVTNMLVAGGTLPDEVGNIIQQATGDLFDLSRNYDSYDNKNEVCERIIRITNNLKDEMAAHGYYTPTSELAKICRPAVETAADAVNIYQKINYGMSIELLTMIARMKASSVSWIVPEADSYIRFIGNQLQKLEQASIQSNRTQFVNAANRGLDMVASALSA